MNMLSAMERAGDMARVVDRLDAGVAGVGGLGEVDLLAVEEHLALVGTTARTRP
jgi:hypothetical protein